MTWNTNYATVRTAPPTGITEENGVRVDERLTAAIREAKKAGGQVVPLRTPFAAAVTPEAIEVLRNEIESSWAVECSSWNAERMLRLALAADLQA